ncbi:MAG: hypothetical protein H0X47_09330 [Nitrospirales bacterium]|nr:hypothetical protein [Nitrospirales bacterium]
MRGAFLSLLIILFLLSLACTSVKVEVKYAEGSTNAFGQPKPPIDPNQLPKMDPKTIGLPASCPAVGLIQKVKAISQGTDVWCWAASALTIMEAHDTATQQCNIVNTVYQNDLTTNCCGNSATSPPSECWRNGWPEEAFNNYAFNWEWVEGPLREATLAGQLCSNGPFIFVLLFEGGGGHTFVVKDLEYLKDGDTDTGKLFLWVYDHYGVTDDPNNLSPTDFQLWSYDAFVDGLWNGGRFRHALDYVQISPIE